MTAKECIDQLMSSNPFMRGCRNIDKFNDYINSLLEILEKQIPIEPKLVIRDGLMLYPCPSCSTSEKYVSVYPSMKVCPNCGQALKWE